MHSENSRSLSDLLQKNYFQERYIVGLPFMSKIKIRELYPESIASLYPRHPRHQPLLVRNKYDNV